MIGFKKFTEDEYQRHSREISLARQTIGVNRTRRIDSAYLNMENGLTLLGVTAVEDRLQEGVPETMEKLRIAGIKVHKYIMIYIKIRLIILFCLKISFIMVLQIWVLTGDKAETAENIAFFCGHFKKGTKVLRLMDIKSIPMCYGVLTNFEYYKSPYNTNYNLLKSTTLN